MSSTTLHLPKKDEVDQGRRRFIAAGSLTVGFAMMPGANALAQARQTEDAAPTAAEGAGKLPGNLSSTPLLDSWIRIDEQGRITVYTGKAELGTGIRTAFIQIAAEELEVDPSAINLITADTGLTPNEGYTAGSHSTADSGTAIYNAAAQVRALLLQSAAEKLGLPADALKAANGVITAPDGRTLDYGQAVSGLSLHRNAQPVSPLIDPKLHKVIGTPLPRVDIPAKVTGGASYVQDMRLPGMVHARAVRAPSYGARLVKANVEGVEKMPGVIKVVQDGSYLAVAAEDEWQAIRAMRYLMASAQWEETARLPTPETIHDVLLKLPAREIHVGERRGAPAEPAVKSLHARYTKPYLSHGSIGPSCAVAHMEDGKLTVWTHAQGVFPLRGGLAEMLGMKPEDVRCIHVHGAGCYGHNAADDVAADAALIARAVPGRPVRVQWMREQEHNCEPYGPAMVTDVRASLDANGRVTDWQYEIWSNSHNQRIDNAGRLMPSNYLAKPFTPAPPQPIPMPEGGGDRNSLPLYTFNYDVQHHFLPDMPLRVSAHRGLGAFMNVFTIESFMDELAAAAGADPVEFRLRHLDNQRARDVIELTAQKFGWDPKRKHTPNRGVGFAFAQYKNLMSYLAIAVELEVVPETGQVRIERVVASVDTGQIVNPDGVRNQIEGGIIQSASWALYEQVRYDEQRVRTYDWSTYPIMRFSDVPMKMEVHLIDRPGAPFLGAGEASQGPTPAAIANAIANATGRRIRELPLTPRLIDTYDPKKA